MSMSSLIGLRVIRGHKWTLHDQDGGPGYMGTVNMYKNVEDSNKAQVMVKWDTGQISSLKHPGTCTLCVINNDTSGVWHIESCTHCGVMNIKGFCWICLECKSPKGCTLCNKCYHSNKHDLHHNFKRIDWLGDTGTEVGSRKHVKTMRTRGICEHSTVSPGLDWSGNIKGMHGEVIAILNEEVSDYRSVAVVRWSKGQTSAHQLGRGGVVEIKCKKAASGMHVYHDHLPAPWDLVGMVITASKINKTSGSLKSPIIDNKITRPVRYVSSPKCQIPRARLIQTTQRPEITHYSSDEQDEIEGPIPIPKKKNMKHLIKKSKSQVEYPVPREKRNRSYSLPVAITQQDSATLSERANTRRRSLSEDYYSEEEEEDDTYLFPHQISRSIAFVTKAYTPIHKEFRNEELKIKEDDVILSIHQIGGGWLSGYLRGKRGVCPEECVSIVDVGEKMVKDMLDKDMAYLEEQSIAAAVAEEQAIFHDAVAKYDDALIADVGSFGTSSNQSGQEDEDPYVSMVWTDPDVMGTVNESDTDDLHRRHEYITASQLQEEAKKLITEHSNMNNKQGPETEPLYMNFKQVQRLVSESHEQREVAMPAEVAMPEIIQQTKRMLRKTGCKPESDTEDVH